MFVFSPNWRFDGELLIGLKRHIDVLRKHMATGSREQLGRATAIFDDSYEILAHFFDSIQNAETHVDLDADRLERLIALLNLYMAKQNRSMINVYQQVYDGLRNIGTLTADSMPAFVDNNRLRGLKTG